MGVLTQKCIKEFPSDGSAGNLTNENWHAFMSNKCKQKIKKFYFDINYLCKLNNLYCIIANWQPGEEDAEDYPLCGNSTGAGYDK